MLAVCAGLPGRYRCLSKMFHDHIEQVWCILRLLYKAGTTLNLKKCKFFVKTIDYLGHVIRLDRLLKLAQYTTDAVQKA